MSLKPSTFILLWLSISIHTLIAQTPKSLPLKGRISYYSDKFQGKKTASGEMFNNNDLTAAHPTLPFNTYIKVTNVANKKSVVVRVNDRGPFTKARILDISKSAAEKLGMMKSGTAIVEVDVLGKNNPTAQNQLSPATMQANTEASSIETAGQENKR